jgi:hypothetical protein
MTTKPKIGFTDQAGNDLCEGDKVITHDHTGKKWRGRIVKVDPNTITEHPFLKTGKTLYGFESSNLITWINDQEYASTLLRV